MTAIIVGPQPSSAQAAETLIDPTIRFDLLNITTPAPQAPTFTIQHPNCAKTEAPHEIVVCAPDPMTHRLDSRTLRATNAAERQPAHPTALVEAMRRRCEPTSAAGCPGSNVVPVTAIAVTIVKAVALAADGQDWRDALPQRSPDSYQIYSKTEEK